MASPDRWPSDSSGALVVALDLHSHEAVAEHSDGRARRLPLTPHRAVGEVTRELLAAVSDLGGTVEIDPKPQEVAWTIPLDEDTEHATYEPEEVAAYFTAATQAALVLAAFRAPYRGRSTLINALLSALTAAPAGGPRLDAWRARSRSLILRSLSSSCKGPGERAARTR
jgi:hypothetical protein